MLMMLETPDRIVTFYGKVDHISAVQCLFSNPALWRPVLIAPKPIPRIKRDAGWVHPSRLPRGPEGRACCRQCGEEVPKGRRTFCGQGCIDLWLLDRNPGYNRQRVYKRDHGVCALCGVAKGRWEMDHTVPLAEGGENTMENFRTLCVQCHKVVTAALRRRLAEREAWKQVKPTGWWSRWPRKEAGDGLEILELR